MALAYPLLSVLALLATRVSARPASLRALVAGADRPTPGLYATPALTPGYGFLHMCTDCAGDPPKHLPWALLTYLHSPRLDESFITAAENNATAIIVVVERLTSDTRIVSRYLMKYAFNEKYLHKLIEIPVITIERSIGDHLAAITRSTSKVPIYVSPEETFRNESICLLLLAVSIVLFIVFIFGFQICSQKNQHTPVPTIICPYQTAVSKIPTQELTDTLDQVFVDENKCAVCIEGFQMLDIISLLPCSHVFHKECIEPWLLLKRLCPMCKMDVIKFYGHINLGSEESIVDIPLDANILVGRLEPDEESLS